MKTLKGFYYGSILKLDLIKKDEGSRCVYVCVWDYVLKNEVLVTYKALKIETLQILKYA